MSLLRLKSIFQTKSSFFLNSSACTLAMRGPKKKKGGGAVAAAPDNPDIVNIFKGGTDAPVYPSDMYPPYVMQMLGETYTPDEIMM